MFVPLRTRVSDQGAEGWGAPDLSRYIFAMPPKMGLASWRVRGGSGSWSEPGEPGSGSGRRELGARTGFGFRPMGDKALGSGFDEEGIADCAGI